MIFDFFKKQKQAPSWRDLSTAQKRLVASRIQKAVRNQARYKVVSGTEQYNREQGMTERSGEDGILDAYSRGRMVDLTRNLVRNSATYNTILTQFDLHGVTQDGGKVILNLPDENYAQAVRDEFAEWTRNADFFDGVSLNESLRLILKQLIIGGDCCLLFDDGLIEDSGKILIYESDEIQNTTDEAIKAHYGANSRQSQGRVYNGNGRWIGAIVSRAQRGETTFAADKCYFLHRDPNGSVFDEMWLMPRNIYRPAQGRGISETAPSLATICDLEDLLGYELQSAKNNAQVLAQVLQTATNSEPEEAVPSAFDSTDFDNMSDEEIEAAVNAESENQTQTISFNKIRAANVIYEAMPEGYKMELLDTKRPNPNMESFIHFLAGRSAGAFGLSQQFATLQVNGADYKANQLFSKRAFEDRQKELERICDWIFYRWSQWAMKKGIIAANEALTGHKWVKRYVSWAWQRMDELDEKTHEEATALKLQNFTTNFKEILGADWKEKLEQTKEEVMWFKEHNLCHPSYRLISGGEGTGADAQTE